MAVTYEQAKAIVLNERPDHIINASFKLQDGYLFLPVPSNLKKDDFIFGGFVKVSNDGELTGYSAVRDTDEFNKALDNKIE